MGRAILVVVTALVLVAAGCVGDGKPQSETTSAPETASFGGPETTPSAAVSTSATPSASAPPSPTPSAAPASSPPPSTTSGTPSPAEPSASSSPPQSKPFEPTEPEGSCGDFGSFQPIVPANTSPAGVATGWPLLELDMAIIADPAFADQHPDWKALLIDLVSDASVHYEEQMGLRLNASIVDRLPAGSLAPGTGDGSQRATARGFMHANYPNAPVDMVAVILGADYEGTTAGQVECVHGAAYPDYAYLWAEYEEDRENTTDFFGPKLFADTPLKVFMHETAHLLAAHHHYSNCGEAVATYWSMNDAMALCDVMINDIGLASLQFGPTNRLVMRSFVEELGIGEPV